MSHQLAVVLLLLSAAIAMFAINRPRMDGVALIMLTVLPFTGVITMGEALAGFSDANVILIAALFVIGDGLVRTGVAQRLGDWLLVKAGSNQTTLLVLLMTVVCALGATMSSTAVTAIFIPVVLRIAQNTGTAPSQLMMPLSFAALISGMTTLVATAPNLVVNSELDRHGHQGFQFFSFTPYGVVVLILGIIYMILARRWLPDHRDESAGKSVRPSVSNWIEKYHLAGRAHRWLVSDHSSLVGKSVADLDLRGGDRINIIAIDRLVRMSRKLIRPTPDTEIQSGDILLTDTIAIDLDVAALSRKFAIQELSIGGAYFDDRTQEIGMAEVIVPTDSALVESTVEESRFRSRFGLTVIGLRHGPTAINRPPTREKLKIGDTLLVVGRWKDIERLRRTPNDLLVLNLPTELDDVLLAPGKAPQAIACLLLVVGLMVCGIVPNVQAALIGCLLMGLSGCVNLTSSYNSINWKTIVLIVGMLPFSIALQRTGGVELAAKGLMAVVGGAGPHGVLAALFAITAILGMFISNTATAVLMAPVAVTIARDICVSPYPFAMTVALAASTAFMTPVSSPVNTLVVGPGNYSFGDFVKIGVPFSLIVLIVTVLMVPWLLPL